MILKSSNQTNICNTDRPRLRCCRISPLYFGMFLLLLITAPTDTVEANQDLIDASIKKPFKQILLAHPDIADSSGARVVKLAQNSLALIGVSQIAPNETKTKDHQALVRIGAIKARTNILKFSHGVEVSNYRGTAEKNRLGNQPSESMALSAFLQVTEEKVRGKIEQLPVVGSWWDNDRNAFHVAVGTIKRMNGSNEAPSQKNGENISSLSKQAPEIEIKGEDPFVDLLQASPVLRGNGGVRLFSINNQKRVIMAVASAKISKSRARAERVARIKAIRELLAHKEGVKLSSVEYLANGEMMRITNKKTERIMLSEFLSIQEESVSGFVSALPVVAMWTGPDGKILNMGIGKLIQ